ncbi:MAG TPA: VCBS repeat-containing protein, partial [Chitinophagaceae bacterium]|nr:VCBS repeat-containing protein [Chitinophagaceae bacterium]
MKNKYLLSLTLLCCAGLSHAQFQGYVYKEDSSIKVTRAGVEKTLAWCGGLNTPQFASADLNKDGLADLVVYQRDRNSSVKTFINTGTAGAPAYRYSPRYSKNFPLCSYYLILKDYNGDGIADLFESGGRGFTAYRGYYNAANELCFDKYKSLYYNNDRGSSPGDINASVNPQDIPAIVDVDNDGDLDFLAYYDDGRFINWYQNMQVELGKPKDTIVIRLADHCWGKTEQKSTRAKNLAVYCDNTKLMRIT